MGVLLAGIDEAGYGPMLGPLCVGLTVFKVDGWSVGDASPDLWSLLSGAVCHEARDKAGRLPVADSKKLKLSNGLKTKHPLVHLERTVLSFLAATRSPTVIEADDNGLIARLGAAWPRGAWYGSGCELPLGQSVEKLSIDASMLRKSMAAAGVELVAARCVVIDEPSFNAIVKRTGTKAEATLTAVGEHLRTAHDLADEHGLPLRVVCDRLGGRVHCGPLVARELPDLMVSPLEEKPERCVYRTSGADGEAQVEAGRVMFMPEAENQHLPVALASMTAKLVRELSMARFNRYWSGRVPELKPTAGYTQDARRWLRDIGDRLDQRERAQLVRLA